MTSTAAVAPVEHVIETELLTKRYGDVVAVDQLSLRVPRGGVFGFLGPNGSGKTTTMGMLLGLVHPTSGEARIFGDPARHASTLRRVGAMVESPTFYPYLTGRANLQYFQGISQHGSPDEVDRLLEVVDLGKRATSKFGTYSLGMKQRLGIACALLGDPELVFLDEPTTGFDPAARRAAWEMIRSLRSLGKTVLLTTHYLDEAEQLADRVAVLRDGVIVKLGTPRELTTADLEVEIRYRSGGEDVVLRTTEPTRVLNELTGNALARGEELDSLEVRRPTLEQVYLDLVDEEKTE